MVEAEQAPGSRWIDAGNKFPPVPNLAILIPLAKAAGLPMPGMKPYEGMDIDFNIFTKSNADRVRWAQELCCRDAVLAKYKP